jgi:hypothetical protein
MSDEEPVTLIEAIFQTPRYAFHTLAEEQIIPTEPTLNDSSRDTMS